MKSPLLSIIVATHDKPMALSICLQSLALQTFRDFECIVVHEPSDYIHEAQNVVDALDDTRFRFCRYPEVVNDFGIQVKVWALEFAKGYAIAHVNGDCYYTPVYLERMMKPIIDGQAGFTYCDWVSHKVGYRVLDAEPVQCRIDSAGWVCRADIVHRTPWPVDKRSGPAPDGWYVEQLTAQCRSEKVPGVLWVHT